MIVTILTKSVCVMAVYTICMLMLLSCLPGTEYELPEDDTIVSKRVGA